MALESVAHGLGDPICVIMDVHPVVNPTRSLYIIPSKLVRWDRRDELILLKRWILQLNCFTYGGCKRLMPPPEPSVFKRLIDQRTPMGTGLGI